MEFWSDGVEDRLFGCDAPQVIENYKPIFSFMLEDYQQVFVRTLINY